MAIDAGDANCTTGLSKRIRDYWVADTRAGFVSPLNALADDTINALCFAISRAVKDEIVANGEAFIGTSLGGLQKVSGTPTDPPASEKSIPLR